MQRELSASRCFLPYWNHTDVTSINTKAQKKCDDIDKISAHFGSWIRASNRKRWRHTAPCLHCCVDAMIVSDIFSYSSNNVVYLRVAWSVPPFRKVNAGPVNYLTTLPPFLELNASCKLPHRVEQGRRGAQCVATCKKLSVEPPSPFQLSVGSNPAPLRRCFGNLLHTCFTLTNSHTPRGKKGELASVRYLADSTCVRT